MYRLVDMLDINRLTDYDRNLLVQTLKDEGLHLDPQNRVSTAESLHTMSSLKISELRDSLEAATDYAAEMMRRARVDFLAKSASQNPGPGVVDNAAQTYRRNFILTHLLMVAFTEVDAAQTARWKALGA